METRPYAPYDLYWLDSCTPPGWFDVSRLRACVDPTLSVSFHSHSTYLGSAGLYPLWQGVYEAWLVLLVPPPEPWEFMRQLRYWIRVGQKLTKAHRLQAHCLADYDAGMILARRLGFVQEATMKAATPTKTDLLLYAKVVS